MSLVLGGSTPQLTFTDGTTQSTAALPLTGGTLTGGLTLSGASNGITFANGSNAQLAPSKVLQVVQATYSNYTTSTSTSFVTSSASISITPLFSTSKVLVMFMGGQVDTNASGRQIDLDIYRGSTQLSGTGSTGKGLAEYYCGGAEMQAAISMCYLDSPATTSSTTYTMYFKTSNGGQVGVLTNSNLLIMIAMEVAQ